MTGPILWLGGMQALPLRRMVALGLLPSSCAALPALEQRVPVEIAIFSNSINRLLRVLVHGGR